MDYLQPVTLVTRIITGILNQTILTVTPFPLLHLDFCLLLSVVYRTLGYGIRNALYWHETYWLETVTVSFSNEPEME